MHSNKCEHPSLFESSELVAKCYSVALGNVTNEKLAWKRPEVVVFVCAQ